MLGIGLLQVIKQAVVDIHIDRGQQLTSRRWQGFYPVQPVTMLGNLGGHFPGDPQGNIDDGVHFES